MNRSRKAELEYKQLLKLNIDENIGRIIVMNKYQADDEETKDLIYEENEKQQELKNAIESFNFKTSDYIEE